MESEEKGTHPQPQKVFHTRIQRIPRAQSHLALRIDHAPCTAREAHEEEPERSLAHNGGSNNQRGSGVRGGTLLMRKHTPSERPQSSPSHTPPPSVSMSPSTPPPPPARPSPNFRVFPQVLVVSGFKAAASNFVPNTGTAVQVVDLSDLPTVSLSLSLSRPHLANDEAHALHHGYACSESTRASLRPKREGENQNFSL